MRGSQAGLFSVRDPRPVSERGPRLNGPSELERMSSERPELAVSIEDREGFRRDALDLGFLQIGQGLLRFVAGTGKQALLRLAEA